MIRRVLPLVSAVSLLLCAALVVLWERSKTRHDYVCWRSGKTAYSAVSSGGEIQWTAVHYTYGSSPPRLTTNIFIHDPVEAVIDAIEHFDDPAFNLPYGHMSAPRSGWTQLFGSETGLFNGFHVGSPPVPDYRYSYVAIPHWLLITITALLPVLRQCRTLTRFRRDHPGICGMCGYDLRATPSRCPECGTPAGTIRQLGASHH